jgi:hypothetical protein
MYFIDQDPPDVASSESSGISTTVEVCQNASILVMVRSDYSFSRWTTAAAASAAGILAIASMASPVCMATGADLDATLTAPPDADADVDAGLLNSTWMMYENDSANGSSSVLSLESVYYTHLPSIVVFSRVATLLSYAIGYPGNLLALYVWVQRRMRQSSGCYLAALAAVDFLFLVLHIFYELQTSWSVSALGQPVLCEAYPVLSYTTQYLSPLLVLAFTVER